MGANDVTMAKIGQGSNQGATFAGIGISPMDGDGFGAVGGGVRGQNNMPQFWILLLASHCCLPCDSDIPIMGILGVFYCSTRSLDGIFYFRDL